MGRGQPERRGHRQLVALEQRRKGFPTSSRACQGEVEGVEHRHKGVQHLRTGRLRPSSASDGRGFGEGWGDRSSIFEDDDRRRDPEDENLRPCCIESGGTHRKDLGPGIAGCVQQHCQQDAPACPVVHPRGEGGATHIAGQQHMISAL